MQPEDYRTRVIFERAELDIRIMKLDTFIKGEKFATLGCEEQRLMRRQLMHMKEYSKTLGQRIELWRPE